MTAPTEEQPITLISRHYQEMAFDFIKWLGPKRRGGWDPESVDIADVHDLAVRFNDAAAAWLKERDIPA